ncbi:MAG: hypothetical protein M3R09_03090 [Actinomycetota bacterium]|nr:hypothetical protein [Actinomycetota bacterium]
MFGVSVALGASTAVAGTVSYDGDAVVFTGGDDLDHELQFRLDGNNDDIIDSQPITSAPGDCTFVGSNRVICPGSPAVRVELGGGRDRLYFNGTSSQAGDCFLSYDIRLGNGSNENVMRTDCPDPATATITSGSGDDTLRGGSPGTSTTIFAGGGNDNVDSGEGDDVIHGGEGADGVFGFLGNDQVYGEGGNDQLRGGDGNDVEDGGPGDDDIGYRSVNTIGEPDPGADQVRGGEGTDRLRLDGHVGAMTIRLDGQANDGTPGEGDNIGSDIESILGTSGSDVFAGSAGPDGFDGGGGGDEIRGAGGNDDLRGGGGSDRVFGDAGDDVVEGTYDTDTVDGGSGSDRIYGDIAGCSVFCSPDVDQLFARDGERDIVNCGGPGTAQVDQLDLVGRCASVDREIDGPPGDEGAAPAKASFVGSKRSIRVSRSGRFNYSFRAGARLSGKAVFRSVKKVRTSRRARVTLAAKSFTVPGGGKVTLKMKLSRKKLAILRRNRRIKTKVTVTLKNAAGRSSVASTTVTLKR